MTFSNTNIRGLNSWPGMLFVLVMFAVPALAAEGVKGWGNNVEQAMNQAAEENKDVLFDFSGSDWCGWCQVLSEEVFSREEFLREAKRNFVLVQLDFPNDRSQMSRETLTQNAYWNRKFKVGGFPTVVLADAKGLPYAITGYESGGPRRYLKHLTKLRGIRERRDELLEMADQMKGLERAELIDAALREVGEELAYGSYVDRIEEIVRLDAKDAAGLRSKYERKLADTAVNEILAEIQDTIRQKGPEEALRLLENAQKRYRPSRATTIELELFKAFVLGEVGRLADAIKVFDRLIASEHEANDKIRLYLYKTNVLHHHEQYEAGIAALDAGLKIAKDTAAIESLEEYKDVLVRQTMEDQEVEVPTE